MRMLKSNHGVSTVVSNDEYILYNKIKSGTPVNELQLYDLTVLDNMYSKGLVEKTGNNYYIDGEVNV